jgi:hypothetical protein
MERSNTRAARSPLAKRVAFAAMLALSLAGPAMAQTDPPSDQPTDLDSAAAFMQTKGGIALAVAGTITLIVLGLKGAKLPRRA